MVEIIWQLRPLGLANHIVSIPFPVNVLKCTRQIGQVEVISQLSELDVGCSYL